jgi:energy-coupling factor transporter ATP-binding protein EcfA2
MPTPADDIAKLPAGARFFRADLHIHSFGGSHDVSDSSMTPLAIVATAIAERLALIAVTDHNEVTNVEETIKAAAGKPLLVVPGVELSTPEGHLLVYFESFPSLEKFWGKLDLADRGTQNSRCQTSMLDCLRVAEAQNGFAILAHVDAHGGLEDKLPHHDSHKKDIFCARALIGFEVKSAAAPMTYSADDHDPERTALGRLRQQSLGLGEEQFLARVMFSDSHTLLTLGKNAQGAKRLTRVKMDAPSFHGLRVALEDADARIRIEDEIPLSVPYVMGVKIDGGFLDGQSMHLSRNLNCIIGGRGAGKSTAFECVRVIVPGKSESRLLDSDIWPDTLHIVWVDEAGGQHTVERRIENDPVNLDDPDYGMTKFSIESYGQGETAHTSSKARQDSGSLLEYLDKFTQIAALREADDDIRQRILQNQSNIEKAEIEVSKTPYYKQVLDVTQKQLLALEKAKAKDVVALERKVAEERSLREQIDKKILGIAISIKTAALSDQVSGIKNLAKAEDLEVGKEQFRQIVLLLDGFVENLKKAEQLSCKEVDQVAKAVKAQVETWRAQEQGIVSTIEQKRKELAAQGVKLDLANIRKLANDEAEYRKALGMLAEWEEKLKAQQSGRAELLKERRTVLNQITALRKGYGAKSTQALVGTLGDLTVSVKFTEGALSQEGAEIIQEAMEWRTAQVLRATIITETVTVAGLLDAIAKNDPIPLTEIEASPGVKLFSKNEALDILKRLGQTPHKFKLERCLVDDRPKITVTKKITSGGTARFVPKDFSKLSMGQQQSVLLALMLSSDSKFPLIIDQPEDNLDGEFIFHSLVPVLRRAKERRQIIVVTHNANIAVLGDAEQIIALKSTSDKSSIVASGSIDDLATKRACCQILEGSEEAFKRRARIYGVTS